MNYLFTYCIFLGIPIATILVFLFSLCSFIYVKWKNKKEPNSFSGEKIKKLKLLLIVSSVVLGVLILVVVGFIILLSMSVAYM